MFSIRALQRHSVPVAKSAAALAGAAGAAAFFNHTSSSQTAKMAETSDAGNVAFSAKVWRLGLVGWAPGPAMGVFSLLNPLCLEHRVNA